MLKGFRDFIVRGNVIDLAIAVVIGIAFNAVSTLTFTVNHSQFLYGDVINAVISFLLIAAVVYFAIVVPLNRMAARRAKPVEITTRECPECLSAIPKAAQRCSACGEKVGALA